MTAAVAAAVVLPLAVASAGPVGDGSRADGADAPRRDAKGPAPSRSSHLLGLGLATATRCGPPVTSPDGIEAQTCVLTQGAETWARTYYRNATGRELSAALGLLEPDGGTVRIDCPIGVEDGPGVCETHRKHTDGQPGAYEAVAEFSSAGGSRADGGHGAGGGPLLLRSGSGSGGA
jgi:hypothetical protein